MTGKHPASGFFRVLGSAIKPAGGSIEFGRDRLDPADASAGNSALNWGIMARLSKSGDLERHPYGRLTTGRPTMEES
jgi:hypothetical protein